MEVEGAFAYGIKYTSVGQIWRFSGMTMKWCYDLVRLNVGNFLGLHVDYNDESCHTGTSRVVQTVVQNVTEPIKATKLNKEAKPGFAHISRPNKHFHKTRRFSNTFKQLRGTSAITLLEQTF